MTERARIDPKIAESFAKQGLMSTLGARLLCAHDGRATIEIIPIESISQQHGFVHAGALAAIADSACGYAAMSLSPPDRGVLSVEFKISLISPAIADRFQARAQIIKPGRKLHFVEADIVGIQDNQEQLIARVSATITTVDQSRLPEMKSCDPTP